MSNFTKTRGRMKTKLFILFCFISTFSLIAEAATAKSKVKPKFDLPDQKLSLVYKSGNLGLFCPPQVGRTTNLKFFRNGDLAKFLIFRNPTEKDLYKQFKEIALFNRGVTYEVIAQHKGKFVQTLRLKGQHHSFPFEVDISIRPNGTNVVIIMKWPESNDSFSGSIHSIVVLESVEPNSSQP